MGAWATRCTVAGRRRCIPSSCGMRWVCTRWKCMVLWSSSGNLEKGRKVALRHAGQERVSYIWPGLWHLHFHGHADHQLGKARQSIQISFHRCPAKSGSAGMSIIPSYSQFGTPKLEQSMIKSLLRNQVEQSAIQQTLSPSEPPFSLGLKWNNQMEAKKKHFCSLLYGFPRDWRSYCA